MRWMGTLVLRGGFGPVRLAAPRPAASRGVDPGAWGRVSWRARRALRQGCWRQPRSATRTQEVFKQQPTTTLGSHLQEVFHAPLSGSHMHRRFDTVTAPR